MKKFYVLLVALFIVSVARTQSCLPEGITFTTQEQIDNFQTSYPGCTEIEGSVEISGNNITNLSGLNVLTSIGGDLNIILNYALTSMIGLEYITSIAGNLYIDGNNALTSLTGLDNLTSIGGSLTIGQWNISLPGNPALTSLSNLANLTSLGGDLIIGYNTNLNTLTGLEGLTSLVGNLEILGSVFTNLTGLDNLTSIGGSIIIGGSWAANALTSLTGLNNLTFIGGALNISFNYNLPNLTGLDNLTSIGGGLSIYNSAFINLTGLDKLTSIGSDLWIFNNPSLSTCDAQWLCDYLSDPNGSVNIYGNAAGCNNLPEVADSCGIILSCLPYGNYYFHSQSDIDKFQFDYHDCTELEGDVFITGNDITNLIGLSAVTSIGGDIRIEGNDSLTNLTGLDNLITIGDELSIKGNSILTGLTGLDNVTSIGGALTIYNSALINLTGLENVTSIGGDLNIGNVWEGGNPALKNLTGLNNVTSIGGSLRIGCYTGCNPALTSLTALNNVTSIGGSLYIDWNNSLTSLTGLDNIDAGSISNIMIINNTSLSTCDVQSICNYLSGPSDSVDIAYNAIGCNSQEEVEAACEVGLDESAVSSRRSAVNIYPNPSCTLITVETTSSLEKNTILTIYNLNGQQLIQRQITEQQTVVDVSNLSQGVYFVKVTDDSKVKVGKIIRQ